MCGSSPLLLKVWAAFSFVSGPTSSNQWPLSVDRDHGNASAPAVGPGPGGGGPGPVRGLPLAAGLGGGAWLGVLRLSAPARQHEGVHADQGGAARDDLWKPTGTLLHPGTDTHTHTHAHTHTHTHTGTGTGTGTGTHAGRQARTHPPTHARNRTRTHAHTHTHTRTHTHTHTRIHAVQKGMGQACQSNCQSY